MVPALHVLIADAPFLSPTFTRLESDMTGRNTTTKRRNPAKRKQRRPMQPRVTLLWPDSPQAVDPLEAKLVEDWHCCEQSGQWDVEQMFSDMEAQVSHAHCYASRPHVRRDAS